MSQPNRGKSLSRLPAKKDGQITTESNKHSTNRRQTDKTSKISTQSASAVKRKASNNEEASSTGPQERAKKLNANTFSNDKNQKTSSKTSTNALEDDGVLAKSNLDVPRISARSNKSITAAEEVASRASPDRLFPISPSRLSSSQAVLDELRLMQEIQRVLTESDQYKPIFKDSKCADELRRYIGVLNSMRRLSKYFVDGSSTVLPEDGSAAENQDEDDADGSRFESVMAGKVLGDRRLSSALTRAQDDPDDDPEVDPNQVSEILEKADIAAQFVPNVKLGDLTDVREKKKKLLSTVKARLEEDFYHYGYGDASSQFYDSVTDTYDFLEKTEYYLMKLKEADLFGEPFYVKIERADMAAPNGTAVGTNAMRDVVRRVWDETDVDRLEALKKRNELALRGYESIFDKMSHAEARMSKLEKGTDAMKQEKDKMSAYRTQYQCTLSLTQLADAKIKEIQATRRGPGNRVGRGTMGIRGNRRGIRGNQGNA